MLRYVNRLYPRPRKNAIKPRIIIWLEIPLARASLGDMTKVDQFESIFRSALKDSFEYKPIEFRSVLIVADKAEKDLKDYVETLKQFLAVLGPDVTWSYFHNKTNSTTVDLIDIVNEAKPDIVCTYRNLNSHAWHLPYSLGEHLDVLVQKTDAPVLVLPHPETKAYDHAMKDTTDVMAMTDHMTNNHTLVNYAVAFTQTGGSVFLSHIEDDAVFERYIDAISKIPDIETDVAREEIRARLLKDPADYIDSCENVLKEHKLPIKVKSITGFGHRISEYRKYIEKKNIDLLVMNSKDEDQLAMHGLVYPLAIELREIPLLLL